MWTIWDSLSWISWPVNAHTCTYVHTHTHTPVDGTGVSRAQGSCRVRLTQASSHRFEKNKSEFLSQGLVIKTEPRRNLALSSETNCECLRNRLTAVGSCVYIRFHPSWLVVFAVGRTLTPRAFGIFLDVVFPVFLSLSIRNPASSFALLCFILTI